MDYLILLVLFLLRGVLGTEIFSLAERSPETHQVELIVGILLIQIGQQVLSLLQATVKQKLQVNTTCTEPQMVFSHKISQLDCGKELANTFP